MGNSSGGGGFPPPLPGVRPPDYGGAPHGGEKYPGAAEAGKTAGIRKISCPESGKRKDYFQRGFRMFYNQLKRVLDFCIMEPMSDQFLRRKGSIFQMPDYLFEPPVVQAGSQNGQLFFGNICHGNGRRLIL